MKFNKLHMRYKDPQAQSWACQCNKKSVLLLLFIIIYYYFYYLLLLSIYFIYSSFLLFFIILHFFLHFSTYLRVYFVKIYSEVDIKQLQMLYCMYGMEYFGENKIWVPKTDAINPRKIRFTSCTFTNMLHSTLKKTIWINLCHLYYNASMAAQPMYSLLCIAMQCVSHCLDIHAACSKASSALPIFFLLKSMCFLNWAMASRGVLCWKHRRQI